mmetsp:Transcript_8/g.25  ORF Transcript_8/g.25 Transcript_8/m.25 type:complete len:257 (-) Transcript_8:114-884(-)
MSPLDKVFGRTASQQHLYAPVACVVVLDFDNTITLRPLSHFDIPDVHGTYGGPERLAALGAWLQELESMNALLAVVSRNNRNAVTASLRNAGLAKYFGSRIYGGEDVEFASMRHNRKSELIKKALLKPRGLSHSHVLFMDDLDTDLKEVQKHVDGCHVHLVGATGTRGLSQADMQIARVWVAESEVRLHRIASDSATAMHTVLPFSARRLFRSDSRSTMSSKVSTPSASASDPPLVDLVGGVMPRSAVTAASPRGR